MTEPELISAARNGATQKVASLLHNGASVNAQDTHGWTALNWAAGAGDAGITKLLLQHGADVSLTGRDNRTPLMIARAANRMEIISLLTDAEKHLGVWQDPQKTCLYAKAYYLRDLRRFEEWAEKVPAVATLSRPDISGISSPDTLLDDSIVYLHQDFTVTKSMWHGENVVFENVTPAWRTYCAVTLGFAIPDDVY